MAIALSGTTGVGMGVAWELPLPLDTKAVAFAAGVELTTAVAGVAKGVGVVMS